MRYSIRIKRSAERELARIAKPQRRRIIDAIDRLADQPDAGSSLKGSLRGLRRIRVGDCRVLYEVLDGELIVLFVRVVRRREAYRHSR
ncbi:type II toxin-antitoxin system RelE family toxin [Candidatus Poriferisodalis sp.]|uniref:type II toxin-antitoxin system RelE family toxin n=1 Tax=Candidatus Poriferisodalis sp. TaxID=3101277 RepID=UPI003B018FA1